MIKNIEIREDNFSLPYLCLSAYFRIFLTLLGILSFLQSSWVFAEGKLGVLVYHHIEEPVKSDVSCTPDQFRAQMEGLLKEGFTPLNLDAVKAYLNGKLNAVTKPVVITFDDGYESLFKFALPVAKSLKIPMIVFLVTSRIGLKPQFTRYLSENEIKEMAESGFFEFGSHTHDLHTNFLTIFQAFHSVPNPVCRLLKEDLEMSRKRIGEILGKECVSLAWPYGNFNSQTRDLAASEGFILHFTSLAGYNSSDSDPLAIKRIPISCRDTVASVLKKAGN